jgi:hypothetical protein
MTAITTSGSAGAAAYEPVTREAGRDVASVREDGQHLAGMLRAAVGFRVDGPEGRVGVLTAVVPEYDDGPPDRIEIATGLFIVTSVDAPFAEVASVDPLRCRVGIRVVPERRRASPREIARRVRRFLRVGGR